MLTLWVLPLVAGLLMTSAGTVAAADGHNAVVGQVAAVVDGDTIQVRLGDRTENVRYIGVDSPEMRHPTRGEEAGAREATEANRRLVQGQTVRLGLELAQPPQFKGVRIIVSDT